MSTEVKVARLPKCDLCAKTAEYDAKTTGGWWANLCEYCFKMYGVGLGTGKGQRLVLEKE